MKNRAPRPGLQPDTSHELDTTDDELAELAAIWPRLEAAIGVDTAGPSAAPMGSGGNGGQGSPSPVHLDTQAVMTLIDVGVRRLEDQVVAELRIEPTAVQLRAIRAKIEAQQQRRAAAKASARRISRIQDADRALTVDEHVTALEAAYVYTQANAEITRLRDVAHDLEQAHTTAALLRLLRVWYPPLADRGHPLAATIRTDVARWRRDARLALGLTEPARKVGYQCPYHPDRPAQLVREPHEAKLAKAVIAGAQPRSGGPLSWRRSETVSCPHCKRRWAGVVQLRTLMKIIDRTTLEAFVSDSVSKAINDEHLHTTLYRCPSCEGVSSSTAWDRAWQNVAELLRERIPHDFTAAAELDRMAHVLICPRCQRTADVTDQVDELDGIAVVLP